jgi:hypothetical protein
LNVLIGGFSRILFTAFFYSSARVRRFSKPRKESQSINRCDVNRRIFYGARRLSDTSTPKSALQPAAAAFRLYFVAFSGNYKLKIN